MSSNIDSVRVAIRVRPFIQSEVNRGCVQILQKTPDEPQLIVAQAGQSATSKDSYTYNNVFMPEDTQSKVYADFVENEIEKVFEGYNLTILAYGQTGSGKTYTMGTTFDGDFKDSKSGVIPRALDAIFTGIRNREEDAQITVTCSFMELYMENLYDLLSGKPKEESTCEIREDQSSKIFINGLTEKKVTTQVEAAKCLMEGVEYRTVGATAMNDESSRSHAIFIVNLIINSNDGESVTSKFTLVDLAGSERSKKTKTTGLRFKEGVKINKGLLALGNVISALGGGQGTVGIKGHISYRDSKLTRLLQDSLGGNSVTLMIACVSPADYNVEETLSTLRYADNAKKIQNKPVKNQNSKDSEIAALKSKIQALQLQILDKNYTGTARRSVEAGQCGLECKQKLSAKDNEILSLRHQLSQLMNVINNLNDKRMFEESFYNETMEKFYKLKELLSKTCPAEFAMPDTNIFDQMKEIIGDIDNLVNNFKTDIAKSESNEAGDEFDESRFEDDVSKQKIVEFTTNQMKALMQIQNLEREMKIKQDLLQRKNANVPFLHEDSEKIISEYREKITTLEKELLEVRDTHHQNARRSHNVSKINMDRKHKISELEKQMDDYRKKISQLERSKKLADQDRKRVEDLTREIQELKATRIQLIKQQRKETETYRKWERSKEKEIAVFKEKERKHQNDMKRLERLHEKQQTVLKRKVEEAKSINRRLQNAMDKSRNIAAMRNNSSIKPQNTDVIQTYMDHELELLMSSVDAKIAMQSLMDDRGTLNERLINLKAVVNKTPELENEIVQLEQDLELRSSQILDMRQKVMQTDLESKIKAIPENFKTPPELRSAMSYMIRAIVEMRDNFTNTKTKAEDLKLAYETSEERIEQLSQQIEFEREEMTMKMEKMENDFEEKLGVWYNMMKREGVALPEVGQAENNSAQFQSLMKLLSERAESSQELQKKNDELNKKNTKLWQLVRTHVTKKSELDRLKQQLNVSTVGKKTAAIDDIEESEEEDYEEIEEEEEEEGFGFNDSFQNDPDWVKTPKYRRKTRRTAHVLKDNIRSLNGTGLLNDISESSDLSGTKRSFQGNAKCSCKGSCATKLCGCKKVGSFCADSCRCSNACVNLPDDESKESSGKENAAASQSSQDGTDEDVVSPKRASFDDKDITTPYYPYKNKKRKPLLKLSPPQ